MPIRSRAPNIAVWSPLAPQHTGVADNVAVVLPELARFANITVIVDDWLVGLARAPERTHLVGQSEYATRRDEFDLCVYHMGNHFGFHHVMHEELVRTPGLVVLHDMALHSFYGAAPREFPRPRMLDRLEPASSLPPDEVAVTSCQLVVEASRAVLVHSEWAADRLRRHFPAARVFSGHLAAPAPSPAADSSSVRRACGWDSEHFVVGAVGGVIAHKRIDLTVRAFAALHGVLPMARLLISGWVHDPSVADRLDRLIGELDIQAVVRIATDLGPVELDGCLLASDVVVDLRAPAAGEIPATILRAFASGRPAIVTDLPQLVDLVPTFCRRVPLNPPDATRAAALVLFEFGRDRAATRRLGDAARTWAEATTAPAVVAAEHREAIDLALATPLRPPASPVRASDGRGVGVTVVGDLTATTGLMEFGRCLVGALESAGVALDHMHVECLGASHNAARDHTGLRSRLPAGRGHATELWLASLDAFPGIAESTLRPSGLNHRVVATWFWELPTVLEPYRAQIARVDEIWTGSPFVRDTLRQYTNAPITVVPVPIQLDVPIGVERGDFGLSQKDVVFLYDFDANSTVGRKNPFGLIEAFSQAFADRSTERDTPRLVLKGGNLHAHRELRGALEHALAAIDGVLVDAELSRLEMNALLAISDVYVSLHRAEGFGLGMAEAMYLGKPVVATVYPQLWMFPAAAAACPVRGRLRSITDADHVYSAGASLVYRPGLVWVEPDTSQAARWMSLLYEHPDLRRRVGTAGARLVREHHSLEAARTVMLERLRIGMAGPSDAHVEHGAIGERLVAEW